MPTQSIHLTASHSIYSPVYKSASLSTFPHPSVSFTPSTRPTAKRVLYGNEAPEQQRLSLMPRPPRHATAQNLDSLPALNGDGV